MIFIYIQLYSVSFGCRANDDQRTPGRGRPQPPTCHFSYFNTDKVNDFCYEENDFCERENQRINIVEDAVQNILTDFSNELASILNVNHDEAQGLAFSAE